MRSHPANGHRLWKGLADALGPCLLLLLYFPGCMDDPSPFKAADTTGQDMTDSIAGDTARELLVGEAVVEAQVLVEVEPEIPCVPECAGRVCGPDHCDGSCGDCGPGENCFVGKCLAGKECDDGNATDWDGCTGNKISEFRVNSTVNDDQEYGEIATFADGRYVVTWTSKYQDGGDNAVVFRLFGGEGKGEGVELLANTHTAGHQETSSIAALEDGGFVIAWNSMGQDGDGGGIFGQRFDAAGNKVGPEFQVNTFTAGNQTWPAVVKSGDAFAIAWGSMGQDGDGMGFYVQRFGLDGQKVGGEVRVNQSTEGHQGESDWLPGATDLTQGGFALAWTNNTAASVVDVFARTFSADGEPLTNELQLNQTTNGSQTRAYLAALGEGGFVATWDSNGQDGNLTGVSARLFGPDGKPLSQELPVNTFTKGEQFFGRVASWTDGFVVAWISGQGSSGLGTQDGEDGGIFAQIHDGNGVRIGGELPVNSLTASDQAYPAIAAFPNGDFLVTWRTDGIKPGFFDVHAQRFDKTGKKLYR
jgi:hypothetical protein